MSGGIILMTVSNLIVKAAGLLFKIPLTSLIGEEGMGYFNGAYTIFTWLYMISCAGLPSAVSLIIAKFSKDKRQSGAIRILRISVYIFTFIGLLGCLFLIFGAPLISHLMRVENSSAAIVALAPTLFFICQSAALRGYFQGFGDLRWHSLSQVIEALGKVGLGVALANYAIKSGKSVPTAAAYAAGGITVGVIAGTLVLYIAFFLRKNPIDKLDATPKLTLTKNLISAALPITVSSSVMSLTNLIDSLIMTRTLHSAGMAQAEVAAIWGNYSSLAVPMFNLPPVLTMPIAYALLPALSSALASGDTKKAFKLTRDAASSTLMLAFPCAVGMSAMAKPILSLLFADDVAERGALLLTLLAPSSMFLCILALTNTVLQASSHERIPLYAMLVGAAMKLISTWLLTPILGKFATPVSTFICYFSVLLISVIAITLLTPLGKALTEKVYIKPLICAAISVTLAVILYPLAGTVISIGAAGTAYLILGSVLHMIKTE